VWTKQSNSFFEFFSNITEIQRVDAFLCSFDSFVCFLYEPFNKPIIVISSYRFEGHRAPSQENAVSLLEEMKVLAKHPDVVFAGSNMYDVMYTNHFIGTRKVAWLPALSDYVFQVEPGASYKPSSKVIPVGPQRLSPGGSAVFQSLRVHAQSRGMRIQGLSELYGHYQYQQLANHPAMILFPYSIHSFGMVDVRALGVPMFIQFPRCLPNGKKIIIFFKNEKVIWG